MFAIVTHPGVGFGRERLVVSGVGHRRRNLVIVLGLAALVSAAPAPAQEPRQGEQWAVAPGAVLDLPGAWDLSQGAGVTVAVIDSGTRLDHFDLARNIWTNFGEVPGNGVDDDDNGYVDDVHGIDLTNRDRRQNLNDGNGHGTHVAGIIAAAANRRGVVGVAPKARIMTVKVLDAAASGTTAAVAEGIRYAAANGARIINMSLGGDTRDQRVVDAIEAANAANVLVICSAGNSGRNIDRRPSYPVSIPAPNVIGVASTSPTDGRRLGDSSNFGRLTVPVAAPGVQVLSTANDGGHEHKTGTSMAAPHATGVAALMAAVRPDATAPELRAAMLESAGRASLPVGAGYLDAAGAVLRSSTQASLGAGQRPVLRILLATRAGRRSRRQIVVQVAILGNATPIRRLRVRLGGRVATTVRRRGSPFTIRIRGRRGGRVRVDGLDRRGRRVARGTRRVAPVRPGKRGILEGPGIGVGTVWPQ
jgi:subtilisin family serine protease